jgi:uncharacterized protein
MISLRETMKQGKTQMNKIHYTWHDIEHQVSDIAVQLWKSNWRPDYIVGIHSGGSIPAVMLSKMLGIKSYTLDVRLRDSDQGPESNCWMADDAFGYDKDPLNILLLDDINDSGATIEWIKDDWQKSCLPTNEKWKNIWGNSTRTAVLINNLSSSQEVDFYSVEVNKAEKDCWIVFPWEEWYKTNT